MYKGYLWLWLVEVSRDKSLSVVYVHKCDLCVCVSMRVVRNKAPVNQNVAETVRIVFYYRSISGTFW